MNCKISGEIKSAKANGAETGIATTVVTDDPIFI